ncbi:uncharacterized protein BCR38DRAFT_473207 [Pseudomassariella vexata]|uniref:Uncharacterized protein n=1 Tax=Pseudomassariella vexata TaxID=1141098 RepID=A0A1Y2E2R3_9PEZI|nr:uncharacterized protein BCR38DRAFT_473207 [Pseudomassariella vexata]ORY65833.1 hypothetical protein BCR38DRAFT_473207 [Pseudomassariella vexata]
MPTLQLDPEWQTLLYPDNRSSQAIVDEAIDEFQLVYPEVLNIESARIAEEQPQYITDQTENLTLISASKNNDLATSIFADTIIYTPKLPEWPQSSLNGTAYVILVDSKNEEKARKFWKNIQFCQAGRTTKSTCAFLDNVEVERRFYYCTGYKGCEYLDGSIINRSFFAVSTKEFNLQEQVQAQVEQARADQPWMDALDWLYGRLGLLEGHLKPGKTATHYKP